MRSRRGCSRATPDLIPYLITVTMIVTSQEALKRSFVGVDFLLLSHGKESMVTKMLYKNGNTVPGHKHPNEQSGYVISGKYILILEDARHKIGPGDSYTIPSNAEHAIEIIEPGEVLDFFSPPRQDYLRHHQAPMLDI